jgi:Domain of unknown function (DUF5655)
MWHSCGRHRIADHLTGKDPAVKQLYRKLVGMLRSCGEVTIYAQKTRIVCMVDVRFASIVVRKGSIDCGLWLTRRAEHPALVRIETFGPHSYGNTCRFTDPSQLDETFAALVKEAHAAHALTARDRNARLSDEA